MSFISRFRLGGSGSTNAAAAVNRDETHATDSAILCGEKENNTNTNSLMAPEWRSDTLIGASGPTPVKSLKEKAMLRSPRVSQGPPTRRHGTVSPLLRVDAHPTTVSPLADRKRGTGVAAATSNEDSNSEAAAAAAAHALSTDQTTLTAERLNAVARSEVSSVNTEDQVHTWCKEACSAMMSEDDSVGKEGNASSDGAQGKPWGISVDVNADSSQAGLKTASTDCHSPGLHFNSASSVSSVVGPMVITSSLFLAAPQFSDRIAPTLYPDRERMTDEKELAFERKENAKEKLNLMLNRRLKEQTVLSSSQERRVSRQSGGSDSEDRASCETGGVKDGLLSDSTRQDRQSLRTSVQVEDVQALASSTPPAASTNCGDEGQQYTICVLEEGGTTAVNVAVSNCSTVDRIKPNKALLSPYRNMRNSQEGDDAQGSLRAGFVSRSSSSLQLPSSLSPSSSHAPTVAHTPEDNQPIPFPQSSADGRCTQTGEEQQANTQECETSAPRPKTEPESAKLKVKEAKKDSISRATKATEKVLDSDALRSASPESALKAPPQSPTAHNVKQLQEQLRRVRYAEQLALGELSNREEELADLQQAREAQEKAATMTIQALETENAKLRQQLQSVSANPLEKNSSTRDDSASNAPMTSASTTVSSSCTAASAGLAHLSNQLASTIREKQYLKHTYAQQVTELLKQNSSMKRELTGTLQQLEEFIGLLEVARAAERAALRTARAWERNSARVPLGSHTGSRSRFESADQVAAVGQDAEMGESTQAKDTTDSGDQARKDSSEGVSITFLESPPQSTLAYPVAEKVRRIHERERGKESPNPTGPRAGRSSSNGCNNSNSDMLTAPTPYPPCGNRNRSSEKSFKSSATSSFHNSLPLTPHFLTPRPSAGASMEGPVTEPSANVVNLLFPQPNEAVEVTTPVENHTIVLTPPLGATSSKPPGKMGEEVHRKGNAATSGSGLLFASYYFPQGNKEHRPHQRDVPNPAGCAGAFTLEIPTMNASNNSCEEPHEQLVLLDAANYGARELAKQNRYTRHAQRRVSPHPMKSTNSYWDSDSTGSLEETDEDDYLANSLYGNSVDGVNNQRSRAMRDSHEQKKQMRGQMRTLTTDMESRVKTLLASTIKTKQLLREMALTWMAEESDDDDEDDDHNLCDRKC